MIDDILLEIKQEYERAEQMFPAFHSLHEGYAVLLEEVDELWEMVRAKQSHKAGVMARKECIQIAAMAIRMIVDRELS